MGFNTTTDYTDFTDFTDGIVIHLSTTLSVKSVVQSIPRNGHVCPEQAERTGFEPAEGFKPFTDLANRRFRPLSHLSKGRRRLGGAGVPSPYYFRRIGDCRKWNRERAQVNRKVVGTLRVP